MSDSTPVKPLAQKSSHLLFRMSQTTVPDSDSPYQESETESQGIWTKEELQKFQKFIEEQNKKQIQVQAEERRKSQNDNQETMEKITFKFRYFLLFIKFRRDEKNYSVL